MVKGMTGASNATSGILPEDQTGGSVGRRRIEFYAHEYFAVRRIQRQVSAWLQTKRQLEKKYMEEYKNKIKKPSGRPKKQRDARVFTVG
ncbi:hypothetical protein BBJ28_00027012 [Nothophytophthora sp. Chile5]|nr:hypothetical protein BBJ28_00027012 [Nothophytophthora sp. Chile5]